MDKFFSFYKPFKDGIHNDGELLSKAIAECSVNKNRLIIEDGVYKCGTIFLSDNTNIYLNKSAIIKLSDDDNDFYSVESGNKIITRNTWEDCTYNGKPSKYFIYAKDKNNIILDGEGVMGMKKYFMEK